MSDSSPHLSQDGGRDAATLDQPLAQLRELLLGIAYPGSPAGSIERRDAALAALQRLEEQLEAAHGALKTWQAVSPAHRYECNPYRADGKGCTCGLQAARDITHHVLDASTPASTPDASKGGTDA